MLDELDRIAAHLLRRIDLTTHERRPGAAVRVIGDNRHAAERGPSTVIAIEPFEGYVRLPAEELEGPGRDVRSIRVNDLEYRQFGKEKRSGCESFTTTVAGSGASTDVR